MRYELFGALPLFVIGGRISRITQVRSQHLCAGVSALCVLLQAFHADPVNGAWKLRDELSRAHRVPQRHLTRNQAADEKGTSIFFEEQRGGSKRQHVRSGWRLPYDRDGTQEGLTEKDECPLFSFI